MKSCELRQLNWTKYIENTNLKANKLDISNLNGLEVHSYLTHIDLSNNLITNVDNIRFLINIIKLELRLNQLESIGNVVCHLKYLKELDLSGNKQIIINQDNFSSCLSNQLESLFLSSIDATRFDSIGNLINLHKLYLDDNKISNIDFLYNLTELNILNLENNEINDIKVISRLIKLHRLYLPHNKIESIHHLGGLIELRELSLAHNRIIDISSTISFNMSYL